MSCLLAGVNKPGMTAQMSCRTTECNSRAKQQMLPFTREHANASTVWVRHLMRGRVGQSKLWGEGFIPRWAVAVSDGAVCQKSIPTVTTAAYFDVCGHQLCDSTCWLHIWGLFSVSGWLSYVWRLQICVYPLPWNSLSSTTDNIQSFTPFTLLGFTTIGH